MTTTLEPYKKQIAEFALPRYCELPDLGLYMNQLIQYIESVLAPLSVRDESPLTTSMVNNYVKQKVLKPAIKKRYDREQIACLLVICLLKPVYTLSAIDHLLSLQSQVASRAEAFDSFVNEYEHALQAVFLGTQEQGNGIAIVDPTTDHALLHAAVIACAYKLFVEKELSSNERKL